MEAKQDILSNFDEQVKSAEQSLATKSVDEAQEVKEDEPEKVVEDKQEEVEAPAQEAEPDEPEAEVEKSAKEDEEVKDEDKDKEAKKSEEEPKDEDKAEKSEDEDDEEEDKKADKAEKSEPKEEAIDEAEDRKDAKKSEDEDEPVKEAEKSEPKEEEVEAEKDLDLENGDGAVSPKPFEKDGKMSYDEKTSTANGQTFEAFKSILTSSMENVSKSFEVSQKQSAQTNERIDAMAKSLNDLTAMITSYFNTEKSFGEIVAVPEHKEEAEPVEDEQDVYVAEKSVAHGSVIKEEEPKEEAVEEVSKSTSMSDLYNKARSLRNVYVDKYQAQAQAGMLTREEYLEKSTSVDDVTYGRNLDAEKLNKFIDYASK